MPPTSRRPIGTRELVIAFALVEAVVLLWLVTRTARPSRRDAPPRGAPEAATPTASPTSTRRVP